MNPPGTIPSTTGLWAPVIRTAHDATLRLLCFPYAGASPVIFRPWVSAIPENVELRVLHLPGRGSRLREVHLTRMAETIDLLEAALAPLFDRPFAFFGHSLGALIAFELARRLQAKGQSPTHLFVSGKNAPDADQNPPFHQLPDAAFLAELRHLNGMPEAVLNCQELLDIMLPVVRSDFTLLETYRHEPGPPLACPMTVFAGTRDPRTNPAGVVAWRAHTTSTIQTVMVPGDHFFIDSARNRVLDVVAQTLRANSPDPHGLARPH